MPETPQQVKPKEPFLKHPVFDAFIIVIPAGTLIVSIITLRMMDRTRDLTEKLALSQGERVNRIDDRRKANLLVFSNSEVRSVLDAAARRAFHDTASSHSKTQWHILSDGSVIVLTGINSKNSQRVSLAFDYGNEWSYHLDQIADDVRNMSTIERQTVSLDWLFTKYKDYASTKDHSVFYCEDLMGKSTFIPLSPNGFDLGDLRSSDCAFTAKLVRGH